MSSPSSPVASTSSDPKADPAKVTTMVALEIFGRNNGLLRGKERKKTLQCTCRGSPRPVLLCALHQLGGARPSWASGRPSGAGCRWGGRAPVVLPTRHEGAIYGDYLRWRRSVWIPTQFCLEHYDKTLAGRKRELCPRQQSHGFPPR